jgi:hypothetical protein
MNLLRPTLTPLLAFLAAATAQGANQDAQDSSPAESPTVIQVAIGVVSTAESASGDPASVVIHRTGDASLNETIAVHFVVSVTAANDGTDYFFNSSAPFGYDPASAGGTLIFLPGEASATLAINAQNDDLAEGTETVKVTLVSEFGYMLGETATATLTIADDDAADHLTEFFTTDKPFDLAGRRLTFTPLAGGGYRGSLDSINAFTSDPAQGTPLIKNGIAHVPVHDGDLDDGYWLIDAAPCIFGTVHDRLYVGTNGSITFGSGDTSPTGTLPGQFSTGQPRISAYWRDLDPRGGGEISYQLISTAGAQRTVITWHNVPFYADTSRRVSVQLELWRNGSITCTWLEGASAGACVIGLSAGKGQPAPFFETDFSRYTTHANQSGIIGWRAAKFSPAQLFDLSISSDEADPDQDGFSNLIEYAFGLEPLTPDPITLSQPGRISVEGQTYLTLTFIRASNTLDATIWPEFSSDLTAWDGTAVQLGAPTAIGNDFMEITYRVVLPLESGTRRFARLRVEQGQD